MKNLTIFLTIVLIQTANATWIRPISHDPACGDYWFRCEMAYDDIEHTFAYEKDSSARQPLDLIFSRAVNADWWSVSLWGEYGTMDSFELWLFHDNQWNLHWDGSGIEPLSVSAITGVTKARVISEDPEHALCLLDVRLREVPEPATILLLICGAKLAFRKRRAVV